MTRLLYTVGIVLIVISFLASVSSFYLLPFSIPVFIVGVILIWIFGSSLKMQLVFSIVPPLLYIPCTAAFLYFYNYSPTKLIFLPKNYEGRCRIVYGGPCGQPYDVYDGMKTISVGSTGTTLLREKFDGKLNFIYRFVGDEPNDLPVLFNPADTAKHDVAILLGPSGVHYIATSVDNEGANEVDFRYADFFLYRKGLLISVVDETVDSLTISA